MTNPEPRNPLYFLLLAAGLVFTVTALAYAVVPVLEQKALEAGTPPPPSAFREALRTQGGLWLLIEVAVLIVLGLACMVLDRLRALQKPPSPETISLEKTDKPPS
jgi:hypothetical protein